MDGAAINGKQRCQESFRYFAKVFPEFLAGHRGPTCKYNTRKRSYCEGAYTHVVATALRYDLLDKENENIINGWLQAFGIK